MPKPVVAFLQAGLLAAGYAIPIDVYSVVTTLSLRGTTSGSAKQWPTDNASSIAVEDCNGGKGELLAYTCRTRRRVDRLASFVLSRRLLGSCAALYPPPLAIASSWFT
jgi:hypothetical protein